MPRLLDNRVIGGADDVLNRDPSQITPGGVMMINPGKKLYIEDSEIFQTTKDAPLDRNGISVQQWLCRQWKLSLTTGTFTSVFGMAYGNGRFVAVGVNGANGVICRTALQDLALVTPMGTTWLTSTSPFTGGVYGVTFAENRFIAVGANGQIAVSPTGNEWTLVRNPTTAPTNTQNLFRVAYAPGKGYVAVGTATTNVYSAGVTLHSPDGITWTEVEPALDNNTYSAVPIYGVGYGNGIFVAVGGAVDVATNHIATSPDGVNWTVQTTSQPMAAHYMAEYGNGRWVVGTNGRSATTPYTSNLVGSYDGTTWYNVTMSDSDGINQQIAIYGNGMWCAAGNVIHGSVDGTSFAGLYTPTWPGTNLTASAGCYGNGMFVIGNRNGYIWRSAVLPEIVSLSPVT